MTGADLITAAYTSPTGGALYMRLADDILSYIRETQIRPGMRIPSERKLAEMFHTSRASVREAVRILHNKGIIDIQVGNGMYLKETLSEDACKIELWKIDYMEVLDIKTVLHIFRIMADKYDTDIFVTEHTDFFGELNTCDFRHFNIKK